MGAVVLNLLAFAAPLSAQARVERFGLIVGNNRGLPDEAELRYAQLDARKVRDTLRDIGGFEPFNLVLLEGESAETLRRALIDLNVRLRGVRSTGVTQVMLFVYYSGHADTENLHLGTSRLPIAELSQLVRGSSADFRLLVLDACRSGVLTRNKGGHITQPFDVPQQPPLTGEGLAFLTASTQNEFAQESDELRGSFFTHAFVSGLLGAADRDHDGNVVLDEAYRYAYDGTVRASSRSASGLQHPTFFYDLRGQGQLVLTQPFARRHNRGLLELPTTATYLVFRDNADGAVMAEVAAEDTARTLSLPPGAYFVRGRATKYMLEGSVQVEPAETTRVDAHALTRIEYAHLVRKGYAEQSLSQSVELLAQAHSALPNSDTLCYGALAGYRLDTQPLALAVRAGFCSSTLDSRYWTARTNQFDLALRALHVFDLNARLALDAGVGLGASYFEQHLVTARRAPVRRSLGGLAELVLGLSVELVHRMYATLDLSLQAYVVPFFDAERRQTSLRPLLSGHGGLGAGMRF